MTKILPQTPSLIQQILIEFLLFVGSVSVSKVDRYTLLVTLLF